MIKKIFNLSKILIKNTYENPYLFNKETHKINKKSPFIWMIMIIAFVIAFISFYIIRQLAEFGEPSIFLNIWFLIMFIIMMFQTILISGNIFYFSEDIKNLLPLPIKPVEFLVSKFNTLIFNLYISEILLGLIPLLMYGILVSSSITFYLNLILLMILFPIVPAIISTIFNMIFMKIFSFIKSKDFFQIVTVFLLIILLLFAEFFIIKYSAQLNGFNEGSFKNILELLNNKISNINKYFLIIGSSVKLLNEPNMVEEVLNIGYLFISDFLFIILFVFLEKNKYLNNILKNNNLIKINKNKKINLENKCKKNNKEKKYLEIELKKIFKNPIYFMQCIFPIFILLITLFIIAIVLTSNLRAIIEKEILQNTIENLSIDLSVLFTIVAIIQILFTLFNISITAMSRDGKNVAFNKNIPISYNKQFVLKGIPQIIVGEVVIMSILLITKIVINEINLYYLFLILLLATIINLINSYLMLIVDFKRPNLNWDNEYEVMKQNNNKIFQYILTIIILLFLIYIEKVLKMINLNIAVVISIIIFIIIFILIMIYSKINIQKLFNKIK